jgi:tetratricopeptide (TPR) repeat protein
MKPLALFAIAVAFFAIGFSRSSLAQQDTSDNVQPAADHSQVQTQVQNQSPPMSPRQVAEMRAAILMARKEYSDAAIAYQHLLETDPRNADFLNRTGMAYQELGQDDLAEHFYKKSMRADKKFSEAINNLGTVEYSRKRYGKAIKYYKKAIDAAPQTAAVYSNLGYAYCAIKKYPAAMEVFGKAVALDPKVFEHRGSSGSILQQRTAADSGELYFTIAKSYAKLGDAERVARYLKLARDGGYKNFLGVEKDPAFEKVIKDPRVREALGVRSAYAGSPAKQDSN